MKSLLGIFLLALICISGQLSAQNQNKFGQNRQERLAAMRVAYITREADLTPDQASAFWPVYNEYQDKVAQLHKRMTLDKFQAGLDFNSMTDAEVEKLIDQSIQNQANEVELLRQYNERFKHLLPIRKLALVYRAEQNFKREVIRILRGIDG